VLKYGIRGLFLSDSNFFADLDWGRRVLEGVVRADLGIVFTRIHVCFSVLNKMAEEDFALLEKAGCKCLAVGVESGSERIRRLLRKPIDERGLLDLNRRLSRYPFSLIYFFMMGFPTETQEELASTARLFLRLLKDNPNASKSLNVYTPYPGTELFDVAVRHGLDIPRRTEDWAAFNYRNLPRRSPWISKDMRSLIEMLDFCSFFVDGLHPFKKTHPLASLAAALYSPLAGLRVEKLSYRFPVEIKLARWLRLYARQS
jgi:radical SAM superfamily enzyme YgiQ (UPF0313 family)